jgi:peptidoglycan/xylan/chitin deacetylase (PgdA/CDA1 family)
MKILPNTIIYFHEIQDKQWFQSIIESLVKNYHIIGLKDLEEYYYNKKIVKNSCHITIDDGDISFYKNAFPIIKKFSIPVSLYASPLIATERKNFWFQEIIGYDANILGGIISEEFNYKFNHQVMPEIKNFLKTLAIGDILRIIKLYQNKTATPPKSPMNMDENQLNEISNSGLVDVGAHTLNHPCLINESEQVASNEIYESIDWLSKILNKEIKSFVYPNGNYGEREISLLKSKGIKLAFTTERGKLSNQDNPLKIPRSGSPVVSNFNNNKAYTISKCLVQLMAGENLYYKYANSWDSLVSKVR